MALSLADKYSAWATLLQFPLISDAARLAHFLLPEPRIKTIEAGDVDGLGRIRANGVGRHCRWMLTDEALVIVRPDDTFLAKAAPNDLGTYGGDCYRSVFSIETQDEDLIVLSGDINTHVVCVGATGMEEYTLKLDLRCFAGEGASADRCTLFGQTLRSNVGEPGAAVEVVVSSKGFRARRLDAINGVDLESIVGWLPGRESHLLIGAQAPRPAAMEDFEGSRSPLRSDHDTYHIVRCLREVSAEPVARIDDARFIACAGSGNSRKAFFQLGRKRLPMDARSSMLLCVDGSGLTSMHEVVGLPRASFIHQVQFDPLTGWFGIADAQTAERERYLFVSTDAQKWAADRVQLDHQGRVKCN